MVEEEAVVPEAAAMLYALSARIEKPLHAGGRPAAAGALATRVPQQRALGPEGCIARCGMLPTGACTVPVLPLPSGASIVAGP